MTLPADIIPWPQPLRNGRRPDQYFSRIMAILDHRLSNCTRHEGPVVDVKESLGMARVYAATRAEWMNAEYGMTSEEAEKRYPIKPHGPTWT